MENNEMIMTTEMVSETVVPKVSEQMTKMSNGTAAVLGGAAVLGIIGLVKGVKKLKVYHDKKKAAKNSKEAIIDIEEDGNVNDNEVEDN